MTERDLSRALWRTSSRSSANGECVEVAVTSASGDVIRRTEPNSRR
ncbi:DUF397 domain-containing protein [Actinoallomurus purpureus]|nr:DUF397 domain-containing protein [Actinoallomurus purpureus]MCO6011377.1 DUF397 domain-containing protein [Actinoallomurus purpureus]